MQNAECGNKRKNNSEFRILNSELAMSDKRGAMLVIETKSSQETRKLGQEIAERLAPGDIVALIGELGAGKTVFAQGLAMGLGVPQRDYVSSPGFTIIKEHKGGFPVYHFDLYRVNNLDEVYDLGYEEYLYGHGVTIIEWAEKMEKLLPEEILRVNISILNESIRRIELIPRGKHYHELVRKIKDYENSGD